jgi:DNA-3-methyladenine glycosylase II
VPRRIRDQRELALLCGQIAQGEPVFALLLDRYGPAPLWPRRNGFQALVRLILEQQVSLESARRRLEALQTGLDDLSPANLLAATTEGLRALGITRQKASYLVGAAEAVVNGQLDLETLPSATDEEVHDALLGIRGVGPWTTSVYLILVLRRVDVWPPGDVALLRSYREVFGEPDCGQAELARRADAWRPYRSVAARLLWHSYLCRRGRNSSP